MQSADANPLPKYAQSKLKARYAALALVASEHGRDPPPPLDSKQWFDRDYLRRQLFVEPEISKSFTLKLYVDMHTGRSAGTWVSLWHRLGQWWAPLGFTHAASQVGSRLLHWSSDSLVTVGDLVGKTALLLYCEESGPQSGQVPNTLEKQNAVLDVVLHWNEKVWYSEHTNHCQAFVMALHYNVSVPLWLQRTDTALYRFAQHMKRARPSETVYPTLVRASGTKYSYACKQTPGGTRH